MDPAKEPLRVLSTCVGMRGIERGLERALHRLGWLAPQTVAYVEIEAFACWNLVEQMESGVLAPAPVFTNLKTFKWELFRGLADFLTGGYPCQPFSLAGKRQGINDPRHLWPYLEHGIATIKPLGCYFENVRQHLNVGYRTVREGLEQLHYSVREGIYSAEEVGAPHRRDRLFILALRRDFVEYLRGRRYHDSLGKIQAGRITAELPGDLLGKRKMGDTNRPRLEGLTRHESDPRWQGAAGSTAATGFPMGQGIEQYPWEEARVKSRLDFEINGYDFTTDLLRMAGNGVVEQVAELAFIDLLEQHLAAA